MRRFAILLPILFSLLFTACSAPQPRLNESDNNAENYNTSDLVPEKLLTIANNHASQGTAIYKNTLLICNKHGYCYMYRLPDGEPIADFPLASYDNSDTPRQNHSNQMMFGPKKFDDGDPFPLLYITTGHSGKHDSTGAYYAKCSVERILFDAEKGWHSQIVQTIEFNDEENIPDENLDGYLTQMYQNGRFLYTSGNGYRASEKLQKIGFGWPHFYVDASPTDITSEKLYIFSSRFCGTYVEENIIQENMTFTDDALNHYIITEFRMPKLPASEDDSSYGDTVTLYPKDITDQFETPFHMYAFQGGTMYHGKIYHAFGYGTQEPKQQNGILVFDISRRKISAKLDLSTTSMARLELECCCIYNGELALSAYNMNKYDKEVYMYVLNGILEK